MQHAEHPFGVDATTLRRDDDPPDYISFREAAINLLIHQDYGDHGRKASIRFFRDQTGFLESWRRLRHDGRAPGPNREGGAQPGDRRSVPPDWAERAGRDRRTRDLSGLAAAWLRPPLINNDKARKTFELLLLREQLFSEEQQLLQAQLGVKLSETEARLFAFACRQDGASLTDAKAVTGQAGPGARKVLNTLVVQRLLEPLGESDRYGLAEHLKDSFGAAQLGQSTSDQARGGSKRMASDQPDSRDTALGTPVLTNLTDDQRKIMALCEVPRKAYLMQETGLSHRTFFRRKRLEPLIEAKLIRMTRPDEPNHPDQAYVVTEAGLQILDAWRTGAGREQDS